MKVFIFKNDSISLYQMIENRGSLWSLHQKKVYDCELVNYLTSFVLNEKKKKKKVQGGFIKIVDDNKVQKMINQIKPMIVLLILNKEFVRVSCWGAGGLLFIYVAQTRTWRYDNFWKIRTRHGGDTAVK